MRIAYLCADPGIPVFGRKGASVHVQEMIRAFRLLGHHVTLFALRLDEDRPDDLIDLPVYTLPAISRGPTPERERQAMALNQDVLALLHQTGPYDVIYERYSLWSTAGMAYAKSRRIVGILEVNAPLIEEQLTHRSLHHVAAAQSCATSTFCDANLITAVSQPVADYLSRFPAVQGKVVVVPNGVNPARFVPLAVRQRSRFTTGFVGPCLKRIRCFVGYVLRAIC
jgi:glycosyltransferase involved in cell wall biosynthesis